MATDIEHFLASHGLTDTTLMGHSMGAKVAMTVALRQAASSSAPSPSSSNQYNPDKDNSQSVARQKVTDLVAIDNAPIDAALGSDFGKYIRGMQAISQSVAAGGCTRLSDADKILAKYEESLAIRQFLLTNLVKTSTSTSTSTPDSQPSGSGGILKWRVPLDTLSRSLHHMSDFPFKEPQSTTPFKGPTLVIRGTESNYVADEALPVFGMFFPMFKVVDVKSGHWVVSENPEGFRVVVEEFLGSFD